MVEDWVTPEEIAETWTAPDLTVSGLTRAEAAREDRAWHLLCVAHRRHRQAVADFEAEHDVRVPSTSPRWRQSPELGPMLPPARW